MSAGLKRHIVEVPDFPRPGNPLPGHSAVTAPSFRGDARCARLACSAEREWASSRRSPASSRVASCSPRGSRGAAGTGFVPYPARQGKSAARLVAYMAKTARSRTGTGVLEMQRGGGGALLLIDDVVGEPQLHDWTPRASQPARPPATPGPAGTRGPDRPAPGRGFPLAAPATAARLCCATTDPLPSIISSRSDYAPTPCLLRV